MKQGKWAERLEQHLADYQKPPSRDLWKGIEAGLNSESKRQARIVMLRRWLVAAALIGVVAGSTLLFRNRQQDSDTIPQHPQKEMLSQTKHDVPEQEEGSLAVQSRKEPVILPVIPVEQPAVKDMREPDQLPAVNDTHEPDQQSPKATPHVTVTPTENEYHQSKVLENRKQERRHLLAMNVYVSGGMNDKEGRNGVQMSQQMLQRFDMARAFNSDSPVFLAGYEERQSHDRPLSFGLTFGYPLTNRLSVATGVVYTKLNSDFLTIMQQNQVSRHQTLHYLGIPLNLQFYLWRWQGLNVYLSGGGQVDWNVEAKSNTDGIDQVMSKDDMQWSVDGSLGVQYNILPSVGVYAEPGVRHYFDNGSKVSNFFKDKPTDFHLELGLRINLGRIK